MEFRKFYPDIQVEFTATEGSDFAPKIIAERDGSQFLWTCTSAARAPP